MMNAAYFETLTVIHKDQTLDQEERYENPLPIVDLVKDESNRMVYIVDYHNERYQEAEDGMAYSEWKIFEI